MHLDDVVWLSDRERRTLHSAVDLHLRAAVVNALPDPQRLVGQMRGQELALYRLRQLEATAMVISDMDLQQQRAVVDLVESAESSWAQIGAALGISKQLAHQRYAARVAAVSAEPPDFTL